MPKSKANQIEAWLPRGWRPSTTGSKATWKNLRGYHVAVMEDHEHQGKWKYRIGPEDSEVCDYSQPIYSDEEAAKRAVLGKLCDKLEIT